MLLEEREDVLHFSTGPRSRTGNWLTNFMFKIEKEHQPAPRQLNELKLKTRSKEKKTFVAKS